MDYLCYTQPVTGIQFGSSTAFDQTPLPKPEEIPDDFQIEDIQFIRNDTFWCVLYNIIC